VSFSPPPECRFSRAPQCRHKIAYGVLQRLPVRNAKEHSPPSEASRYTFFFPPPPVLVSGGTRGSVRDRMKLIPEGQVFPPVFFSRYLTFLYTHPSRRACPAEKSMADLLPIARVFHLVTTIEFFLLGSRIPTQSATPAFTLGKRFSGLLVVAGQISTTPRSPQSMFLF